MPHHVPDPDHPGKPIDVIELLKRDPHKPLPPDVECIMPALHGGRIQEGVAAMP